MNRYSTITFEIEAEFDLEQMWDIWVTLEQGKKSITKKKSNQGIDVQGNICTFTLSQEETGMFAPFMPVSIQLRWITADGDADSSTIEFFALGDVLEEGEMSV